MASLVGSVGIPPQPSTGFLRKCAKEQEKLRTKLQRKLQNDLLQLLNEGLFSDVVIKSSSSQTPLSVKAHVGILKVRVPTFYTELCQNHENRNDIYNSDLDNVELLCFLRKVYSEDDIRRYECEAVWLSKKSSEAQKLSSAVSPIQQDSSTFKVDEQDNVVASSGCLSSNGDIYVTPTCSPLSPDKKAISLPEEVFKITATEQESKRDIHHVTSLHDLKLVMETKDSEKLVKECNILNNDSCTAWRIGVPERESSKELNLAEAPSQELYTSREKSSEVHLKESIESSILSSSHIESSVDNLQDKLYVPQIRNYNIPRSDTFELKNSSQHQKSTESMKEKEDDTLTSEEAPMSDSLDTRLKPEQKKESFFLHEQTNILTDRVEINEPSAITTHARSFSGHHVDGGMTDSGFMSQTQSLMSDTDIHSSLMSSVMTCTCMKSSHNEKVIDDISENKPMSSSVCSGSLFPMYIDMKSVVPQENVTSKTQKHQKQQGVYMYIDATPSGGGDTQNDSSQELQNTSYVAETKRQSVIPQEKTVEKSSRSEKVNSCYMYVDLDSVTSEDAEKLQETQQKNKERKNRMSVSMFVEIDGEMNDSVRAAQEMYSSLIDQNIERVEEGSLISEATTVSQESLCEKVHQQEKQVCLSPVKHQELALSTYLQSEKKEEITSKSETQHNEPDASVKIGNTCQTYLLPMSPITKRKQVKQEPMSLSSDHVVVKTSIKPEDVAALEFPVSGSVLASRSPSRDSLEEANGKKIEQRDTKECSYEGDKNQWKIAETKKIQEKTENKCEKKKSFKESSCINSEISSETKYSSLKNLTKATSQFADDGNSEQQQLTSVERALPQSQKNLICTNEVLLRSPAKELVISGTKLDNTGIFEQEVVKLVPTDEKSHMVPGLQLPSVEEMRSASDLKTEDNSKRSSEATIDLTSRIEQVSDKILKDSITSKFSDDAVDASTKLLTSKSSNESADISAKYLGSQISDKQESWPKISSELRTSQELVNVEKQLGSVEKLHLVNQTFDHQRESIQTTADSLEKSLLCSPPLPWTSVCDVEDDSETIYSEVSDVSSSILGPISFQTLDKDYSQDRHSLETEGITSYKGYDVCSKLGEDLLRMFLEEINSDVVIRVGDKDIRAHKCILVTRSKYFEAILKGDRRESADDVITLKGYSYSAVHFVLCHIYSGAINFPKNVNIVELAQLSDMLALDSLKEVVVFNLKMNYCHFFHKPCNHCIVGVAECLPLTATCGLQELQNKAIHWIGKYFVRIWTQKAFASLPNEFLEKCYKSALQNLSVETTVEMLLSCDRLMTSLPPFKWTEPVFGLVTRLIEDSIRFTALNFDKVLTSDGFLALGKGRSWNVTAVEDNISAAVGKLSPNVACSTYVQLGHLLLVAESQNSQGLGDWTQNFIKHLHHLQRLCERFLIQHANLVVHCSNWNLLPPESQKKIKDSAVIVIEFEKPTAPPPQLSSLLQKSKKTRGEEMS
ncbi:uncharacterized protein LOC143247568 [Tachypleus tridentatus]|uniref:uncharacterized protein LOC143247568 n=1 Tax=Tachypleus tridentatus TaxID=6853 RepID=UPI003FD3CF80